MLHLTPKQARDLGLNLQKKKRKQQPRFTTATWKAERSQDCVKITIPENMPPLNVWKHWHHMKYNKYVKYLTDQMTTLARECKAVTLHKARIQIIHYHRCKRRRDDDGYAPKPLVDALRYAGFFEDDNHDQLEQMRPIFEINKTGWRTEVHIYPRE